jgi:phenylacetate-coenzyme A ligase PaaK-like adenylate-forming protein
VSLAWSNPGLLRDLLARAWESPHSSFYRRRFEAAGVGEGDFRAKLAAEDFGPLRAALPTLSRADLVASPVAERTFVDPADVRFFGYTSGTTSGAPLVVPFSRVARYWFEPSLGRDVRRPLIVYPPLNGNFGHTFIQQCAEAARPVTPVFADFRQLPNAAVLARETGADAVYATPTIAAMLAEHVERHYDPSRIRLLALGSETLTAPRRAELARRYPNAAIANLYASAEVGQYALVPCARAIDEGLDVFHPIPEAIAAVELVDGELVISYGGNPATPLVRYRTGDGFALAPGGCPCGSPTPALVWDFRDGVDRVRANGVEVTVEQLDRAVAASPRLSNPRYRARFSRGEAGRVRVEIEIEDAALAAGSADGDPVAEIVAGDLSGAWAVGNGKMFRDAVAAGLFEAPRVRFVAALPPLGLKDRRLVSEL